MDARVFSLVVTLGALVGLTALATAVSPRTLQVVIGCALIVMVLLAWRRGISIQRTWGALIALSLLFSAAAAGVTGEAALALTIGSGAVLMFWLSMRRLS